ncbi:MAG: DNA recombination protein RmuC, partial [Alistipes sp.]|nr:DNA recombination protein RmuC [Alistipes sp.]
MNTTLVLALVLLGAIAAALAALCAAQRRENRRLAAERTAAQEEIRTLTAGRAELETLRTRAETELEALRRRTAEEREAERERREKAEETLRLQFRHLAAEILSEQSQRFGQTSRESIDLLLKPFKDNIADFRKRVEEIYTAQTSQRGELKNELQRLMELNRSISAEAQNLTTALKGKSKV